MKFLIVLLSLFVGFKEGLCQPDCDKCAIVVGNGKGAYYQHFADKERQLLNNPEKLAEFLSSNDGLQYKYCVALCLLTYCLPLCEDNTEKEKLKNYVKNFEALLATNGQTPMICGCEKITVNGDYDEEHYNQNNLDFQNPENDGPVNQIGKPKISDPFDEKLKHLQDSMHLIYDKDNDMDTIRFPKELIFDKNKVKVKETKTPDEYFNEAIEREKEQEQKKRNIYKSIYESGLTTKISTWKSKPCDKNPGIITPTATILLSFENSLYSLNGAQKWTDWISLGPIAIRYSKTKYCGPLNNIPKDEKINTIRDYAFIQLKNPSVVKVSGRLQLTINDGSGTPRIIKWPFALNVNETEKEDPGAWYYGCEVLSVQVIEMCEYE